jgi:pyroglutamyl-peptidase
MLLTSFTTWKDHHRSNSSDDLLQQVLPDRSSPGLHFLRQLPVDFEVAPQLAIAQIQQLQPRFVVCCGMAETRDRLTVEVQAVQQEQVLTSRLDLAALVAGLAFTDLSYDAGDFVCNRLYFDLLHYVQTHQPATRALFVHVPVLSEENGDRILTDFRQILERLKASVSEQVAVM